MTSETLTRLEQVQPSAQRLYDVMGRFRPVALSHAPLKRAMDRADGMTPERDALLRAGLIRWVGKRPPPDDPKNARKLADHFDWTPEAEIAAQVERNVAWLRSRKRRKRRVDSRVSELREVVRERGDYFEWLRARNRMHDLTKLLADLPTYLRWEVVAEDDAEAVAAWVDEMVERWDDVRDHLLLGQEAVRVWRDEQRRLRRIGKLLETNGRTPAEAETARRLAGRLRAKL